LQLSLPTEDFYVTVAAQDLKIVFINLLFGLSDRLSSAGGGDLKISICSKDQNVQLIFSTTAAVVSPNQFDTPLDLLLCEQMLKPYGGEAAVLIMNKTKGIRDRARKRKWKEDGSQRIEGNSAKMVESIE
jgi:hypothetical protein